MSLVSRLWQQIANKRPAACSQDERQNGWVEGYMREAIEALHANDWAFFGLPVDEQSAERFWSRKPKSAQKLLSRVARLADEARDSHDPAAGAYLYEAAVTLAPWRSDLRGQLGNMLKDSGRFDRAISVYQALIQDFVEEPEPCLQLGFLYNFLGRRRAAIAMFNEAIKRDPLFEPAHKELYKSGETIGQKTTADRRLFAYGSTELKHLTLQVEETRQTLDQVARLLPEIATFSNFPEEDYRFLRRQFEIPAPQFSLTKRRFVLILPQTGVGVKEAALQISTISRLTQNFRLLTIGCSDSSRAAWERSEKLGQYVSHVDDCSIIDVDDDEIIIRIEAGRIPHQHSLDWFLTGLEQGETRLAYCDEEIVREIGQDSSSYEPVRLIPRPAADPLWLAQTNTIGGTIAYRADAWREYRNETPRDAVRLELTGGQAVSHIPLPLMATFDDIQNVELTDLDIPVLNEGKRANLAVVICTRDNAYDCAAMVDSLEENAADTSRISYIIVDNGTSKEDHISILCKLNEKENVYVKTINGIFNWSLMNNIAAKESTAEYILFCNDDMKILSRHWDDYLERLLCMRNTGAVGARLLYADDTIQHGGVFLGWGGVPFHDGLFEARESTRHFGRWSVTREASAVTGAFLATHRKLFLEIGGFDANGLAVAYSDIDYCLQVRKAGYKVIYTAQIELLHDESATRGLDHLDLQRSARCAAERSVFEQRWPQEVLSVDPTMNPAWAYGTLPMRLLRPVGYKDVTSRLQSGGWAVWKRLCQ